MKLSFSKGNDFRRHCGRKRKVSRRPRSEKPLFAGKSYEENPERLKVQLEGYFTGPDGPGAPGEKKGIKGLKGVIAPHIDFQRGGFCYAFAHREIWEKNSSHCFIIFGTAHTLMEHPFCLTRKEFITPLGTLEGGSRTGRCDPIPMP